MTEEKGFVSRCSDCPIQAVNRNVTCHICVRNGGDFLAEFIHNKEKPELKPYLEKLKIGQEIYIRANVSEIRKDYIICENAGGYFGTVREEIRVKE